MSHHFGTLCCSDLSTAAVQEDLFYCKKEDIYTYIIFFLYQNLKMYILRLIHFNLGLRLDCNDCAYILFFLLFQICAADAAAQQRDWECGAL